MGDKAVAHVAMDYFHHIFTTSHPSMIDEALQDFEARVTVDMKKVL